MIKAFLTILLLTVCVSAQGSLFFGAGTPSNVKHPKLWAVDTDYGPFFVETVWKPTTPNHLGYGLSDGAGGMHTILLGYQSNGTQWAVTGNFYTGTGIYSFGTPYVGNLDQWAHVALGYDGSKVRIWVDGLIVFEEPYSGSRKYLAGGSDGNFYVGGSYHNNFGGNIARVRLREGLCPFTFDFRPQLAFTRRIVTDHVENFVTADFVADYTTASEVFPDLGKGLWGELRDGTFSRLTPETDWPQFQNDRPRSTPSTHTPAPVPEKALVFDSFSRANSGLLFSDQLKLGSTEGGSLGPLAWSDGFGIMGESAYARYNTLYQNVLETGQSNVEVRVDRVWGTNTGLALRYVNAQNFLLIQGFPHEVRVINVVNGVYSIVPVGVSQGYTTLRAVLNGSTVTVHADGSNLGTFAVPSAINGTKHGLAYAGSKSFYDNFTVFGVQ